MQRGALIGIGMLLAGCIADVDGEESTGRYTAESRQMVGPFIFGETMIDHEWKTVSFGRSIEDPVVVAGPLSSNGSQAAVIRIRKVSSKGFEMRVQEWPYLDGKHYREAVGYIAAKRGFHKLSSIPGGVVNQSGGSMPLDAMGVELGTVEIDLKDDDDGVFHRHEFKSAFPSQPIILAAVTSFNGSDTVVSRIKDVNQQGFAIRLQEQEDGTQAHAKEQVSYLAITRGSTTIDGYRFVAGGTDESAKGVTHELSRLSFGQGFGAKPVLLASMQTTNGSDTANLRWRDKTVDGVRVQVSEEQSADEEIKHTSEGVGFLAVGKAEVAGIDDICMVDLADVKRTWSDRAMYTVFHVGVMNACNKQQPQSPSLFCPDEPVLRGDVAQPLLLAKHLGKELRIANAKGIFDDVSIEPDGGRAPWIEQLFHEGITNGCQQEPKLLYCPNKQLTRRAAAVMLLRAKHGKDYTPPPAEGLFDDVEPDDDQAAWMEQLYREDITVGCDQDEATKSLLFCPDDAVTRQMLALLLVRTFAIKDTCGDDHLNGAPK